MRRSAGLSVASKISEENKKILKNETSFPHLHSEIQFEASSPQWRRMTQYRVARFSDAEQMGSDEVFEEVFGDLIYLEPEQLARVAKRAVKLMKLAATAADTRSAEENKESEDKKNKAKYSRLARLSPPGPPPLPPGVLFAGQVAAAASRKAPVVAEASAAVVRGVAAALLVEAENTGHPQIDLGSELTRFSQGRRRSLEGGSPGLL